MRMPWLASCLVLALAFAGSAAADDKETSETKIKTSEPSQSKPAKETKASKEAKKANESATKDKASKDKTSKDKTSKDKASKDKSATKEAKAVSGADRDRAREACRAEARRRDYRVDDTGEVRGSGDRLYLTLELRRNDRRYTGECSYDVRGRDAALRVREGGSRPSGGSGNGGSYASNDQVRDKCIQEVSGNARTQLVSTGKIERRGDGVSAMDMVINVEGQERRVKCYFDNRTRAANIR